MPRKKTEPDHSKSSLTFTIETFDDPATGQPTQYGRFSRNWQDEAALDALIEQLEAGRVTHKQALMQARKLEATTPDNLVIQKFIANRLWTLGLQDEAAEVYKRAFRLAQAHIPKGYSGQITWSEVDNRSFLRLAHGTLLGLMRRRDGNAAMALAHQMLAWCPMDNIGVRFLLGDIALLKGDHHAALQEYLKGAPNSPAHWYQAALIAFREGDYVAACTYLRRGIAANPYIAEGLTGRTVLTEHLYWHASNVHGPEWAIDYLEAAACDWTAKEIDFVDWVFNAAPVLKERAAWMALNEGMTYGRDAEKRAPYAQRSLDFIDRITDTLSKRMMQKVKNRWGDDIWRGIEPDSSGRPIDHFSDSSKATGCQTIFLYKQTQYALDSTVVVKSDQCNDVKNCNQKFIALVGRVPMRPDVAARLNCFEQTLSTIQKA